MTAVRRAGAASAATLTGLALTLGLIHAVAPEWARAAGLDVWNLPSVRAEARAAADEGVGLQAVQDALFREIELTDHVVAGLVAGDVSLADAAAELEPMLANRPGFMTSCETHFGTTTLRDSVPRYLIDKVGRLPESSSRAAALTRLEREYAGMR